MYLHLKFALGDVVIARQILQHFSIHTVEAGVSHRNREELSSQQCNMGGVQRVMWSQQICVARNLTYCSAQFRLESCAAIYFGLYTDLFLEAIAQFH